MKRTISSILSLIIILSSVLVLFTFQSGEAEAAIYPVGASRYTQDENNPNLYYFVGMVYYEVWKDSGGKWTDKGHKPGDKVSVVDGGTYQFTFASGRRVKNITVKPFNFDGGPTADKIFNTSRGGELAEKPQQYYNDATSSRNYDNYDNTPVLGKGTNSARKEVIVKDGVLLARAQAVDRRLEEEIENKKVFHPNVEGYRYFFPTLFTIELEPEEGKAVVKYWTTTGQSLDGVDGFANKEVKLEKDKSYNFTHTAPSEKYTYEGHKKSTQGDPSSLSRKSGDPGQFVYNGQYPNYYVYFYYKLKGDPPPPGGPTCTQPAPGRTIDGKYMDPVVTAMIKADQRGSEMFDVLKGIPTSESLYGNVFSRDYLFQNKFVQMTGTCEYKVTVLQKWTLTWMDPRTVTSPNGQTSTVYDIPRSEPDERRPEYTVIRPYSYWTIAELGVYNIMEATLENYAFSGEQIVITPEGYTPPDFTADTTGDIYPAPDPGIVPGPSRTKPGEQADRLWMKKIYRQ
ncbi:DUF5704 domain-containing protein [Paenibacillus sp. 1A_MP2]|uniref:DUF5704 domain-containing protein n=1 Tax=Paenibacillus sp. 1A_MP2 TaxID=3457495 RepID=UPI003FCE1F27